MLVVVASNKVQQVKRSLAAKSDDWSSVSRSHMPEEGSEVSRSHMLEEGSDSCKLFPTSAHVCWSYT